MPRESKLLPYLQIKGGTKLKYVRRVPTELQKYLSGRRYITRIFKTACIDVEDRRVVKEWGQIHSAVEAELKAAYELVQQDSQAREPVSHLSPRDVAGIAAQPLLEMLRGMERGKATEMQLALAWETVEKTFGAFNQAAAQPENALAITRQARSELQGIWLKEILDQLQINPSEEVLDQIKARFSQYSLVAIEDRDRLKDGDFSGPELESKAPPLPARQVTYQQLLDAWVAEQGGIREIDGVGIGNKQIEAYERNIAELVEVLQLHYPAEIEVEDVRKYLSYLQKADYATTTKQLRLSTFSSLFEIGTRIGLLDGNPFVGILIKEPRAERKTGYRAFSKDELVTIFAKIKSMRRKNEHSILPLALLMTGARASDILCLRHSDIAQTSCGIWYFKMLDRPLDKYPRMLKGNKSDERHTPMHPELIKRGFLKLIDTKKEGYVFSNRCNASLSCYFKRILKSTGIYEMRTTVVHSLRGTAIDAWRKARIPEDARRALTAHSSRDVQERAYGENLQFMPDVLHKELIKVDWSWLP